MNFNKGAVGIFVALCALGGATGYYLATGGPGSQPAQSQAGTMAAAEPAATQAVEQLVVDQPGAGTPAPAPVPVVRPAAERRTAPRTAPRSVVAPAPRPQPTTERTRPVPAPAENQRALAPADGRGMTPAAEPERLPETNFVEPSAPPQPQFVELVVPAESVIGLQMETSLTSERARVEDEVIARVTRDVRVDDRVAIPSGARAHGQVTLVDRGGRLRERARLGIRFTSVVLADGTRVPLETDTIYREGDSPGSESAAKIGGGAIGGAIIGGILGGARGAVIGGSVGAGAGTAAAYAGGRNAATMPSGTPVTVRLVEPASVTVEY